MLALTVHHEAGGEGEVGMLAVGCVIRNRQRWGRWGATMRDVCLAPKQFSCWSPAGGPENYRALVRNADQIRGGRRPDELRTAYRVAMALEGDEPDITDGADHYYAPAAMNPPGRKPDWAVGQMPVVGIQRHVFYKLRKDAA